MASLASFAFFRGWSLALTYLGSLSGRFDWKPKEWILVSPNVWFFSTLRILTYCHSRTPLKIIFGWEFTIIDSSGSVFWYDDFSARSADLSVRVTLELTAKFNGILVLKTDLLRVFYCVYAVVIASLTAKCETVFFIFTVRRTSYPATGFWIIF